MAYKVILHPNVVKYIRKLPTLISDRIKKKLKLVEENPFHFLEHYEAEDIYKLRIGDYRALIDVDKEKRLLIVRVLNHRKRIYKR